MNTELTRLIQTSRNNLEKTLQLASELQDIDFQQLEKESMAIIADVCATEQGYEAHKTAIAKGRNIETSEMFDEVYKEEYNKVHIKDMKSTKAYQDMVSIINIYLKPSEDDGTIASNNVIDEDIEMEENIPTMDPITKNPLVHPVRNKICNHVYEKSSILEAIKMNSRTRCSTLGCSNKEFIALRHLIDDTLLQKKLAYMRNQHQQAQSSDEDD